MNERLLPLCRVLIVSADDEWRRDWVSRLRAAEESSVEGQTLCQLQIDEVADEDALRAALANDGLLQCIILDAAGFPAIGEALSRLRALRSEIDIFLAVPAGRDFDFDDVELIDRHDSRAEVVRRRLRKAIARRAITPFADTLRDYVEGARDAWHTPGHSSGDGLRDSPWVADFYRMMGEHVFNADLSVSVQELDSLLDPLHVIQAAQDLAAKAFGARRTFFVTGGTSMANKVIVQHLLGRGGKMLVDQACHKSVHHAAILCGVDPVYLPASANTRYGLYGPVAKARIFEAIELHPDAALLILTSSTYDGFYYDLQPIIERAHAAGIKVLVDEAWYAHGFFHPALRPCALECGADYVTQSTHKMLSAFSQASMIHVSDETFDEARFREHLNMHTSTSPQYGLIASLDVARKQMSMEGFLRLSRCLDFARQLRAGIAKTGCFRVLDLEDLRPEELLQDNIRLDPNKLTIDVAKSGRSARQIQRLLYDQYSIQVEKVTHNTLSVLVTLGTTQGKVLRLVSALQALATDQHASAGQQERTPPALPALGKICMRPRDAYFGTSQLLALTDEHQGINEDLIGEVCADQVVPYPPGIPVLVPGQQISIDVLEFLRGLVQADNTVELHGVTRSEGRIMLRVVTEEGALA